MMGRLVREAAQVVRADLAERLSPDLTADQVDRLTQLVLEIALVGGGKLGSPLQGFTDLVVAGFNLGQCRPMAPAGQPYDPPKPDAGTAAILDQFAELAVSLQAIGPTPPNGYLVGMRGSDLYVGNAVVGRISKGQALNLAVWLVALADPELTQFAPMLAKVISA